MNPTSKINRKTPCAAVLLLGLVTFLVSVPAQADSVSMSYTAGTSNGTSTPGVKLTLPAITDPGQSAWQLTSFTWLSTFGSGANATGRGYISIFDATLFDPADKSATDVNSETTGLIARSGTYANGVYSFSTEVILEAGKSYYFLNSKAVTTNISVDEPAPYGYGFSNSVTLTGIERWLVSSSGWHAQAAGAPKFSALFSPVMASNPNVPEPATISALLGLAGLAVVLCKHRSRRS
ncbi:MAG: PEP-CTERM sorting domain-containing protein [Opitutaceae bacterium]|jgi:hypothetical protein|nr:PEP-CTERM sorting domain-containing protein [Opitutaceae bacterium]